MIPVGSFPLDIVYDSVSPGSFFNQASNIELIYLCSASATALTLNRWVHMGHKHLGTRYPPSTGENKLPQLAEVPNKHKLSINSASSKPTHLFGHSMLFGYSSQRSSAHTVRSLYFSPSRPANLFACA